MPELLTRRKTPQSIAGWVAGFKSEWWPDSFRNGGRHQIGTMAGFTSESPAGFNRNPHFASDSAVKCVFRKFPDSYFSKSRTAFSVIPGQGFH